MKYLKLATLIFPPLCVLAGLAWAGMTIYQDVFVEKPALYVGPELKPGIMAAINPHIGAPCDVRYATITCINYQSLHYAPKDANYKEPEPVFVRMYRAAFEAH